MYHHITIYVGMMSFLPPATYMFIMHSGSYNIVYYIVITIVERDTRKYHEFIAEYCYKCEARVTIPKAMNE